MPRMLTCVSPTLAVSTIVTFGISETKSAGLSIPARSIVSSVNAVIAIGTSCRLSARFRAVTTTSSIPPAPSSCPSAGVTGSMASAATPKVMVFNVFMVPASCFIVAASDYSRVMPNISPATRRPDVSAPSMPGATSSVCSPAKCRQAIGFGISRAKRVS